MYINKVQLLYGVKCTIVCKLNTKYFRPELNVVALQPWTNLHLPEKIDEALEEVYSNLIISLIHL